MVRLSTIYDKSINKKVFFIRGDETYTHTTKTILTEVGRVTSNYQYLNVSFSINVLRDLDDSTIAVYDNDMLIDSFDWTSGSDAVTKSYNLNWDTEHNIYVKYMGNNSCLASKSDVISIQEINPNTNESSLIRLDSVNNFTTGASIPISVKLVGTTEQSELTGKEIQVYVDDVLKTTLTTDSNYEVNDTLTGLGDGKHNIRLLFAGYNHISSSEITYDISVGYEILLTEYPQLWVSGATNTIKSTVKDYFGNPIVGGVVSLNTSFATSFADVTTDSDGVAVFVINPFTDSKILNETVLITEYTDSESNTYYSDSVKEVRVPLFNVSTLNSTVSRRMVSPSYNSTIKFELPSAQKDIPISVTGEANGTFYTNQYGQVIFNYKGTGKGDVYFEATVGTAYNKVEIEDVLQYLSTRDELNVNYEQYGRGQVGKLTNGYKIIASETTYPVGMILKESDLGDWQLDLDVVNVSKTGLELFIAELDNVYFNNNRMATISPIGNGSHVTCIHQSGNIIIYVDDVFRGVSSATITKNLFIGLPFYSNPQDSVILNNIKLKRC